MPLPNTSILYAIFESYLNIRSSTWSLDSNDPIHSKLDITADEKRASCIESLNYFKNAKTSLDWISVSYQLYDLEQCEYKKVDKSWLGWFGKIIGRERIPYLAETLCAARAYINLQLHDDHEFIQCIHRLTTKVKSTSAEIIDQIKNIHIQGDIAEFKKSLLIDKSKLAEQKLKALTEDQNYQRSYFTKITQMYDHKSTELNEYSFDDFILNVKNGSRKNTLCNALLHLTVDDPKKSALPLPSIESPAPQPSSYFSPPQLPTNLSTASQTFKPRPTERKSKEKESKRSDFNESDNYFKQKEKSFNTSYHK